MFSYLIYQYKKYRIKIIQSYIYNREEVAEVEVEITIM